jgi:hypothetical protein
MIPVPEIGELDGSWMKADIRGAELTPKWKDIPEEFKRGKSVEEKLFHDVFFGYVELKNVEMAPREGVDRDKALRVLNLIGSTMGTGHEVKTAGWAYLCHEWFIVGRWARKEGHHPWR